MRKAPLIAAAVILLIAVGVIVVAWPHYQQQRMMARLVATDPEERQQGWIWLKENQAIDEHRDAILQALRNANDDALLDGAIALDEQGLWGWPQDADLVLREVDVRTNSSNGNDVQLALERMQTCPIDMASDAALPRFKALLNTWSPSVRQAALEAALAWAGQERVAQVLTIMPADANRSLARIAWLADAWKRPSDGFLKVTDATPEHEMAQALHLIDGPAADEALKALAEQGDATAKASLRQRSNLPSLETLWTVATDTEAPIWQRRLAAWYGAPLNAAEISAILRDDPAEPDGTVYSAVLLAERKLPLPIAQGLARSWITDLNDDKKRAGALLAALLAEHPDRVKAALETEDIMQVRTAQRNALLALGEPIEADDPIEFAYRTLHKENGDFNPDTAMCLLLAGHEPALGLLVSRPYPDRRQYRESVQQRAWLLERFAPSWHKQVGRPLGSDPRSVTMYFDLLRTLQLMTQGRMQYNEATRTFEEEADDGRAPPDA
jgi:hypothetical protein